MSIAIEHVVLLMLLAFWAGWLIAGAPEGEMNAFRRGYELGRRRLSHEAPGEQKDA